MAPPHRGAFIVVEGLDKSGKTTQTSMLYEALVSEGRATRLVKFPDRTTAIGKMIDSYLRSESELDDHAVHLLFSANRWEVASSIKASLTSGTTVVCDRYAFSGIAFTFAKSLLTGVSAEARQKLTYEWCRAPDVGLPAPDLTLFLDVSPEIAKMRGGYGSERYEKEEHQQNVREVFARIREDVQRTHGHWVTIDAGKDKHILHEEILTLVKEAADDRQISSLGTLWSET